MSWRDLLSLAKDVVLPTAACLMILMATTLAMPGVWWRIAYLVAVTVALWAIVWRTVIRNRPPTWFKAWF